MISDRRLMVGGAAIFAAIMVNHHNVMDGDKIKSPLLIRSLRDIVFS